MYRRTFLAFPSVLLAANSSNLNGRWDLTVPSNESKRAWWLEIKGMETPQPTGSFIGAPGGDLDPVTDISTSNGEVRWSITRPSGKGKVWKGSYRARPEGDKLAGSLEVSGQSPVSFSGKRAPVFRRDDPDKLKSGNPVELINGKDMSGWRAVRTNAPNLWKVEDGIMKNGPGTTDILSDAKFMDFKLHAEYRVGPHSNSGIGLRGRYEVQILEDYGQPPDTHGNGALYSRILPRTNASKPANEWQTFDITLAGNVVTVVLNGINVIDRKEIDGLTAMAIDPNEAEPGPIVLQGDHGPVEFRKLTVTPLS